MRFVCLAIGLWALAARLQASTVDVTLQSTLLLQSGDSLTFLFTDSSYSQNALSMGLATSPSQIFFNLVSAPVGSAGQFTTAVQSQDGSASVQFSGPVGWTSGMVQTSGYMGPASVVMNSLMLSGTLSQEIFAESAAELTLTYAGPDVTMSLPGSLLKNDLQISLSGGGLSVGAMDYDVTLSSAGGAIAPEPDSVTMLFTAGGLLCALSAVLKRFGRSRAASP